MVQTLIKSMNLETFLAIPETKPASEFVDGEIIQKPMPQGKHQGYFILNNIFSSLNP